MSVMRDERGAAALLTAAGMVLFLGMAAMTIDLGLAFNERRQDQSAVDASVMAGALEAVNGTDAMIIQAIDYNIDYARRNLDTPFTSAEWQAAWEGCVDPAADRNAGGYNFVPLTPPASWGWTLTDPSNWCISIDASEFLFRVRLPQQIVETTFGKVLGVDQLETGAFAVARLTTGGGGVLPFGIPAGAGNGGLTCLSGAPGGLASDPCDGPTSGDFGTVELLKFGNSTIPTNQNCNGSNPGNLLAQNIAHGADHIVYRDLDGLDSNAVVDTCFLPTVDTLRTDPGFPNNGLEEGLVGPDPFDAPYSYTPRLQHSGPLVTKFGFEINNEPLWSFLDPATDYGPDPSNDEAPLDCDPASFDNLTNRDWDILPDGIDDPNKSWQHMNYCIFHYLAGGYDGVMFLESIETNTARFVYVPEFWDALGPGSAEEHIKYFRATYLQGLMWQRGNTFILSNPGEQCFDADTGLPEPDCNPSGNWAMKQMTAFVILDTALPEALRGSSIAGSEGVNPFTPELFR